MKPLSTPTITLAALAAAALLACVVWAANWPSPTTLGASRSGSIDERLDRLIRAQEAQDQRLERLESLLASSGKRTPASGPTAARTAAHLHHEDEGKEITPEQKRQKAQELISQLESKFMSEPVSSGWAAGTEKLIDSAFSEKNLAMYDAPKPLSHQAACRSFSCRVQVVYADDMQADSGQQFLLADITSQLPKAKLLRLPRPDGTVEVVAYANTGRVRR